MSGAYFVIGGLNTHDDYGSARFGRYFSSVGSVIKHAGKEKPAVAYIDAANENSHRDTSHIKNFVTENFPDSEFHTLDLDLKGKIDPSSIKNVLDRSNLVFINGGPELDNLLAVFKRHNLNKILKEFHDAGGFVGGQSAGGIVLAEQIADGDLGRTVSGAGLLMDVAISAHIERSGEEDKNGNPVDRRKMIEDAGLSNAFGVASAHALILENDKLTLLSPKAHQGEEGAFYINGISYTSQATPAILSR